VIAASIADRLDATIDTVESSGLLSGVTLRRLQAARGKREITKRNWSMWRRIARNLYFFKKNQFRS
jgi:hypothetical protein